MQSYLHCFLLSRFAGILLTERSLELSRDREVPIRTGREAKLAERLLDGRVPVASTLSHRSVLNSALFQDGSEVALGEVVGEGAVAEDDGGLAGGCKLGIAVGDAKAPAAPRRCGGSSRRRMGSAMSIPNCVDFRHRLLGSRRFSHMHVECDTARQPTYLLTSTRFMASSGTSLRIGNSPSSGRVASTTATLSPSQPRKF